MHANMKSASALAVLGAIGALLAALGCEAPPPDTNPPGTVASRIVGGAASSAYPAVGILNVGNATTCSGVLIAPNLVLTAAHCFSDFYRGELAAAPPVWFFVGEPGSRPAVRAARIAVHPDTECRFTQTARDLAYVVLASPVTGIEPLAIARAPYAAHCDYIAVGYGRTSKIFEAGGGEGEGGTGGPLCEASEQRPAGSPALLDGTAIIPSAERKALRTCTDPALSESGYVGSRSEAGSICLGDSGSPLIDDRTKTVVGIASGTVIDEAGVQCETGSKAVYTPVSERLAFIDEGLAAAGVGASPEAGPDPSDEGCRAAPASAGGTNGWPLGGIAIAALSLVALRGRKPRRI